MNKSEIAEKAARYKAFTEQLERNVAEVKIGINDNSPLADEKRNYISGLRGRIEERKNAMELVERAIAESQAPRPEKLISLFSDLGSTWAVLRNCKDFMDAEKGMLGGFWKQFDKLMGEAFRMQIALIKSRQESPKGNENV